MGWTLRSLLSDADVDATVDGDAAVGGLSYDARHVAPGDLFCCIRGANADGHEFVGEVAAAGAAAVLVDREIEVDLPVARVLDVRSSLGPIASTFFDHPSRALRIAGVTGTNGKTTVTYLLEAVVTAAGLRPGLLGTVRYRVGDDDRPAERTTPEAVDLQRLLAEMRSISTDVVAMEVASHALDYHRVDATRFACAGFTNLSQDHLDLHGDMESYFAAKARLFDVAFTPTAVINVDDPYGRRLAELVDGPDVMTYALSGAEICCASAPELSATGTRVRVSTPTGDLDVDTRLVGVFNVSNVLCAIGMAVALDLPLDAVASGIEGVEGLPGRLEVIDEGQPFAALVDYAHTPDALEHVIDAVRGLTSGRLIVVFGCGGDRDRDKRPLMGAVATRTADLTVVTSDNPRSEDPDRIASEIVVGAEAGGGDYTVVLDRREAIAAAVSQASAGDVVLVAGKGHEQGQTFADRTMPFDDREVTRDLIREVWCRS